MRAFILITAFISTFTAPSSFAMDKAKLMDAFFSVIMVRGYNADGGLAYGSGVIVGKDQVLTNCHVLRTTKQPWVSKGEDSFSIVSVKADAWHDLCLVTTHGLPYKAAVIGKSSNLKRGQEVAAIGHSSGAPAPITSRGTVKGLYDSDHGKIIRSGAKFLLGASGSGLFDMDGNLVGINTFKTAGHGGSIHFALPIEWLTDLEKQAEITNFPITGKALWEEDEDKKPFYMQVAVPESREEWPKMAELATKWTQAEPKSAEAWYSLGLANESMQNLDVATQAYRQSINCDKGNFNALLHLGIIAKTKGDTTEMHRVQLALNELSEDLGAEYSEMMGCDKTC